MNNLGLFLTNDVKINSKRVELKRVIANKAWLCPRIFEVTCSSDSVGNTHTHLRTPVNIAAHAMQIERPRLMTSRLGLAGKSESAFQPNCKHSRAKGPPESTTCQGLPSVRAVKVACVKVACVKVESRMRQSGFNGGVFASVRTACLKGVT